VGRIVDRGEGWHNNHHMHPVSAAHGMAWWEVDLNYWLIRLLALLGLAKDIKVMRRSAGFAMAEPTVGRLIVQRDAYRE